MSIQMLRTRIKSLGVERLRKRQRSAAPPRVKPTGDTEDALRIQLAQMEEEKESRED